MSIDASAPVTAEEYERLALADEEGGLELHFGRLRRKPPMTMEHNDIANELGFVLRSQLDRRAYLVQVQGTRLALSNGRYVIPDVVVVPWELAQRYRNRSDALEVYAEPLPLVAEVWSRSTGDYDLGEKLASYRERGDREIWLVHPYELTVTAWRRLDDTTDYDEMQYHAADLIDILSLPAVQVDLHDLFGE